MSALDRIPNRDALIEILRAPGAPPRITLDLTESELDGEGAIHVALDGDGNLIEVSP